VKVEENDNAEVQILLCLSQLSFDSRQLFFLYLIKSAHSFSAFLTLTPKLPHYSTDWIQLFLCFLKTKWRSRLLMATHAPHREEHHQTKPMLCRLQRRQKRGQ
jgi:hypothetical protein